MVRPETRVDLAVASPVRVSAEAPGSRLRPRGENRPAERSVEAVEERGAKQHWRALGPVYHSRARPESGGVWAHHYRRRVLGDAGAVIAQPLLNRFGIGRTMIFAGVAAAPRRALCGGVLAQYAGIRNALFVAA